MIEIDDPLSDSGGDLDWMASDVADIRDVDLEVYGNSGLTGGGAVAMGGLSRVVSRGAIQYRHFCSRARVRDKLRDKFRDSFCTG